MSIAGEAVSVSWLVGLFHVYTVHVYPSGQLRGFQIRVIGFQKRQVLCDIYKTCRVLHVHGFSSQVKLTSRDTSQILTEIDTFRLGKVSTLQSI